MEQEKKEMKHQQEEMKNQENDAENNTEASNEQIQEYRQQLYTWFAYHPCNIEFIVKALGVNGTRTVVAGVPILININAYRYPRDERGLLTEERKNRLETIREANKQELPEEPTSSAELLKRPTINEDEEEDIEEGETGDLETIRKTTEDVYVHNPYCSQSRFERWWFIVTDARNQVVINATNGYIPFSDMPFVAKVYIPSPSEEGTYSVNLHIICDSYLKCEQHIPIRFNCVNNTIGQEEQVEEENEHEEKSSDSENDE